MSRARLPERARQIVLLLFCLASAGSVAQDANRYAPCTESQRRTYLEVLGRAVADKWRLPDHYRGTTCVVEIVQTFRGEVLNARVVDCTNPVIVKSVEDAAYLASPLPLPRKESCYLRTVEVKVLWKVD